MFEHRVSFFDNGYMMCCCAGTDAQYSTTKAECELLLWMDTAVVRCEKWVNSLTAPELEVLLHNSPLPQELRVSGDYRQSGMLSWPRKIRKSFRFFVHSAQLEGKVCCLRST